MSVTLALSVGAGSAISRHDSHLMPVRLPISGTKGGYAAIDAMVALTIITSSIALSLVAGETALKLTQRASELAGARERLTTLVESQPTLAVGTRDSGSDGSFRWRVDKTLLASTDEAAPLCRVSASLVSVGSGRSYDLSAVSPCGSAKS